MRTSSCVTRCRDRRRRAADSPNGTAPRRPCQEVASGLRLSALRHRASGRPQRLFIVEKGGADPGREGRSLLADPFLDLTQQGRPSGGEQGLLGLAFDPDYATNGRFVGALYRREREHPVTTFSGSAADPDQADPGHRNSPANRSRAAVLQSQWRADAVRSRRVCSTSAWVTAARAVIPGGSGQTLADLLGPFCDWTSGAATALHSPADNPFVGQAGVRPEIWSYGLRNPWRFSFDRATGDLYIARRRPERVGRGRRCHRRRRAPVEALNFGWNIMEGQPLLCQRGSAIRAGLTLPVLEYDHGAGLLHHRRVTSTAALPFRPFRAITSTPTIARGGSAASGCRTGGGRAACSGPRSRPAEPSRASARTPRASSTCMSAGGTGLPDRPQVAG